MDKLAKEFEMKSHKFLSKNLNTPPGFVLHSDYLPGRMQAVFDEIQADIGITCVHVYISLKK